MQRLRPHHLVVIALPTPALVCAVADRAGHDALSPPGRRTWDRLYYSWGPGPPAARRRPGNARKDTIIGGSA